jgi:hypothetical protein
MAAIWQPHMLEEECEGEISSGRIAATDEIETSPAEMTELRGKSLIREVPTLANPAAPSRALCRVVKIVMWEL